MNVSVSPSPLAIAQIADADIETVVALWQRCGLTRPWNDPHADIALARRDANSTVLIGWDGDAIVASAMVGHDGHRGWIYSLVVDPLMRRKKIGTKLLHHAENALKQLGCVKINLQILEDNNSVISFYKKNGYSVEARVSMGKEIRENI